MPEASARKESDSKWDPYSESCLLRLCTDRMQEIGRWGGVDWFSLDGADNVRNWVCLIGRGP